MVGVGVFTTSGYTLAAVGDPAAVIILWAIAGGIALMGAICYGGLAKQVTQSGGEYLFLSRGVHPLAGFMAGWISLFAGFSGAIGLSAVAFAKHLPDRLVDSPTPWAVGLIALLTIINLLGLRPASHLQTAVVLAKLVFLTLLAVVGCIVLASRTAVEIEPVARLLEAESEASPQAVRSGWPAVGTWASSLMWISFSYAGYNAAIYIAGAAREGRSSVPRSMVWGTAGVTILYVILNFVFVYAAPSTAIANQNEVAMIATEYLGGTLVRELIRGVILVSLGTSVLAMIQVGPHVYAQMARDRMLPTCLDSSNETPRLGIVVQAVIAIALVLNAGFLNLLEYLAFLLSLSSAATILVLLLPGFRGTPGARPVPGWPWLPIAFALATLMIAGFAFHFRWQQDSWGLRNALIVVPVGLVFYAAIRTFLRK